MRVRARPSLVWAPPLAILAMALCVIVLDPARLATQIANLEYGAYRDVSLLLTPLVRLRSPGAEAVLLAISGAALVLLFGLRQWRWAGVATLAALAALQALGWFLYADGGLLFDAANPCLAFLAIAGAGYCAHLFEAPDALSVRAGRRGAAPAAGPVTSLACALRHSAELGQALAGDQTRFAMLVEAAMQPLVDDARGHGAIISHFDGVSFSAHWPSGEEGGAIAACEAANRMRAALARTSQRFAPAETSDGRTLGVIEIGIGLATGPAILASARSRAQPGAWAIGEAPLLAKRLRLVGDRYGAAVIASEGTRQAALRAFAFLEVDFLALGPGEPPVRLYALIGNSAFRASPKFRALSAFHDGMFQMLRARQWEKARGFIEQSRRLSGVGAGIYDLHLERISGFEAHPPASDWDGAFRPLPE